jgi:ABC-type transport system involved in Fe-S cluster assembly fused permease/ATPase subunit
MMRDVIERFAYRFELWRKDQREDSFGSAPREVKISNKSESIPRMAIRHIYTWLIGIGIATGIGRIIVIYFPRMAFGVFLAVLVLLTLWTFAAITVFIGEWRAKKKASADASNLD